MMGDGGGEIQPPIKVTYRIPDNAIAVGSARKRTEPARSRPKEEYSAARAPRKPDNKGDKWPPDKPGRYVVIDEYGRQRVFEVTEQPGVGEKSERVTRLQEAAEATGEEPLTGGEERKIIEWQKRLEKYAKSSPFAQFRKNVDERAAASAAATEASNIAYEKLDEVRLTPADLEEGKEFNNDIKAAIAESMKKVLATPAELYKRPDESAPLSEQEKVLIQRLTKKLETVEQRGDFIQQFMQESFSDEQFLKFLDLTTVDLNQIQPGQAMQNIRRQLVTNALLGMKKDFGLYLYCATMYYKGNFKPTSFFFSRKAAADSYEKGGPKPAMAEIDCDSFGEYLLTRTESAVSMMVNAKTNVLQISVPATPPYYHFEPKRLVQPAT